MFKLVTASLCGGLGNQLFQYAAARSLAVQCKASLVLDLSWFDRMFFISGETNRSYALSPFMLPVQIENNKFGSIGLYRLATKFKKLNSIFSFFGISKIYAEKSFQFDPLFFDVHTPIRLSGYWQSYKYFESIAAVIRNEIGTPRNLSEPSLKILKAIKSTNAICIHIRRGDYLSNQAAAQFHGLCSMDYYRRGVELVTKGLASAQGFVFTDDPVWAKNNLQLPLPFTVIDINGPEAAHEDLWLMSACQRFVIANSSLSWWGAWLSIARDKMVVAPKKWFLNEEIDTCDLIPVEWIRI